MNRQETAIGNGSRWLDGLGGPGRAVPRIIARSRDGNFSVAQCPRCVGDLNRSTQHLLILLDKEVADGDVTDIVHGEAEG